MADPRITIAGREISVLRKEKTIVLALLIQLFIAAFSSFLVVGLVSLYSPAQAAGGYTVEVAATGDAVDELQAAASEAGGIAVRPHPEESSAQRAFQQERVQAVIVAEKLNNRIHVRVLAPTSNVRTTLIVVQIRDALRKLERNERRQRAAYLSFDPLGLPPETKSSPYYSFTYTVLIPLLLILPVFIGGALAVDSMTEELDRGTLELLRVAPVSLQGIVEGKLLAAVALAPAQAALWLALLWLNGTSIQNPIQLLVLVTALATVVVALGISISLPTASRRSAQLAYSTGVLFLFGVASLLPGNPANVAARLAIGSPGTTPTLAIVGYVALGLFAYVGLRKFARRMEGQLT